MNTKKRSRAPAESRCDKCGYWRKWSDDSNLGKCLKLSTKGGPVDSKYGRMWVVTSADFGPCSKFSRRRSKSERKKGNPKERRQRQGSQS